MERTVIFYRSGEIKGVIDTDIEEYAKHYGWKVNYNRTEDGGECVNDSGALQCSFICTTTINYKREKAVRV